jgi:hypothetical protein
MSEISAAKCGWFTWENSKQNRKNGSSLYGPFYLHDLRQVDAVYQNTVSCVVLVINTQIPFAVLYRRDSVNTVQDL